MKEPTWLIAEAILAIHEDVIRIHGGSSGVRDRGLLESALARPRNVRSYEPDATLERLAASYAHGIVKNHPFIDGNKRTAFLSAYVFLDLNGKEFRAPEAEATVAMLELAAGTIDEQGFARWLRDRSVDREIADPAD